MLEWSSELVTFVTVIGTHFFFFSFFCFVKRQQKKHWEFQRWGQITSSIQLWGSYHKWTMRNKSKSSNELSAWQTNWQNDNQKKTSRAHWRKSMIIISTRMSYVTVTRSTTHNTKEATTKTQNYFVNRKSVTWHDEDEIFIRHSLLPNRNEEKKKCDTFHYFVERINLMNGFLSSYSCSPTTTTTTK